MNNPEKNTKDVEKEKEGENKEVPVWNKSDSGDDVNFVSIN